MYRENHKRSKTSFQRDWKEEDVLSRQEAHPIINPKLDQKALDFLKKYEVGKLNLDRKMIQPEVPLGLTIVKCKHTIILKGIPLCATK